MVPSQEHGPDAGQGDNPEDRSGITKDQGLQAVAVSKDPAKEIGQRHRKVLSGQFGQQSQRTAVARHSASCNPGQGVAAGQAQPDPAHHGKQPTAGGGVGLHPELAAVDPQQNGQQQGHAHQGQNVGKAGPQGSGAGPGRIMRYQREEGKVGGSKARNRKLDGQGDVQRHSAAPAHSVGTDEEQNHRYHGNGKSEGPREPRPPHLQARCLHRRSAAGFELAQCGNGVKYHVPKQGKRPVGCRRDSGQDGTHGEHGHRQREKVPGLTAARAGCVQWAVVRLLPPAGPETQDGTHQADDSLGMSDIENQQDRNGEQRRRKPAPPQDPKLAAGGHRNCQESGVGSDQGVVDHQPQPAVARVPRQLREEQKHRHRGKLATEEQHCRLEGPKLPLGEAQQQQDHQGSHQVSQRVGGKKQRGKECPPVAGPQPRGTDARHGQELLRRPAEETAGHRPDQQEDPEDTERQWHRPQVVPYPPASRDHYR